MKYFKLFATLVFTINLTAQTAPTRVSEPRLGLHFGPPASQAR